ncbi:hypothetical protein ACFZCU_14970 [Streptomyces canus]|uniref:hypothetical protein n=1 Tax=Streptomyces canus TaxID=58343 RepID=UPI0036E75B7C
MTPGPADEIRRALRAARERASREGTGYAGGQPVIGTDDGEGQEAGSSAAQGTEGLAAEGVGGSAVRGAGAPGAKGSTALRRRARWAALPRRSVVPRCGARGALGAKGPTVLRRRTPAAS